MTDGGAEPDQVARQDPGWVPPIATYLGILTVLLVVSWLSVQQVSPNGIRSPAIFQGDWFWGGWVRWDGGWYWNIAEHGYSYTPGQQSSVAFFPGYPLTVRAVGRAIDNVPLGGILTTIVCGFGAVVVYWRWLGRMLPRRSAGFALATLAVYPYAWYLYGAVYGDSLFLLAALSAFVLLENDRPVLAGIAGAVATATRAVGVAVVIGLVIGVLERRGAFEGTWRWRLPRRLRLAKVRPADLGVLLAIGGLVAWSAWLWHRYGDPLLFSSVQEYWGQPSSPETWFKRDFFATVLRGDDRTYAYGLVLQSLIALGVLLLIPAIVKRFGLRYGAYTLVLVAIPVVGSQDFQGLGRYMIGAFPAFAVVGEFLARRRPVARIALPASAGCLALGTGMFAHGLYLS